VIRTFEFLCGLVALCVGATFLWLNIRAIRQGPMMNPAVIVYGGTREEALAWINRHCK
jgi:hypothetical protein